MTPVRASRRAPIVLLTFVGLWPHFAGAEDRKPLLLKPAHVFDGVADEVHDGWVVLVRGDRIESVGPSAQMRVPANARVIDLPETTLLPGLIDAHSHLLLH